jgi:uncharacterized protein YxjI
VQPAFAHERYVLRRQVLALTGRFRFYTPDGALVLYSEQKMFRLREDIRVYGDEAKRQELLWIQARQILDFAAAYDVIDTLQGARVGVLRRRGFRSLVRDTWEILDAAERPLGLIREDNLTLALLRRLLLGSLVPQRFDVLVGEAITARFNQQYHLLRYVLDVDFSPDFRHTLDRRLGLAAALLLAAVEGKQHS